MISDVTERQMKFEPDWTALALILYRFVIQKVRSLWLPHPKSNWILCLTLYSDTPGFEGGSPSPLWTYCSVNHTVVYVWTYAHNPGAKNPQPLLKLVTLVYRPYLIWMPLRDIKYVSHLHPKGMLESWSWEDLLIAAVLIKAWMISLEKKSSKYVHHHTTPLDDLSRAVNLTYLICTQTNLPNTYGKLETYLANAQVFYVCIICFFLQ